MIVIRNVFNLKFGKAREAVDAAGGVRAPVDFHHRGVDSAEHGRLKPLPFACRCSTGV
jgi:hypothetical protein